MKDDLEKYNEAVVKDCTLAAFKFRKEIDNYINSVKNSKLNDKDFNFINFNARSLVLVNLITSIAPMFKKENLEEHKEFLYELVDKSLEVLISARELENIMTPEKAEKEHMKVFSTDPWKLD